jgi:hypothetical protein
MKAIFLIMILFVLAPDALADEEIIPMPMDAADRGEVEAVIPVPTKSETDAACKKYESKFIGYYGRVFRVEKCKKRPIEDSDAIYQVTRRKNLIIGVDADVVRALPDGEPLVELTSAQPVRTCKELSGQYLTHNFSDLYYMKNCQLIEFPDYETYIEHRKSQKNQRSEFVSVTAEELRKLGKVVIVPSVMDAKDQRMSDPMEAANIIPIDVACKGLNEKYVSFYSLMYKIEKCRKRQVDPEKTLIKFSGKIQLKELTPEQWISLPDGEPLNM